MSEPTDDIIALDIASTMGIAEGVPGGKPRLYTVKLNRDADSPEDCFGRATLWIAERLTVSVPTAVWIEAPLAPGSHWGRTNSETTLLLIGLWAAIAGVVRARGVPCRRATVASVRRHFLGEGNGHMPGPEAKRAAFKRAVLLGWAPKNHDESDAAALWDYAGSLYRGRMVA